MLIIPPMMARATVSAALSRTGNSTAKRVRWSIIEREDIFAFDPCGYEVDTDLYSTKSTHIFLNGRSTGK